MRIYTYIITLITIISTSLSVYAIDPETGEETFIAVVGGTTFGQPDAFGKGLVEEEGVFTIDTESGESPPIYRMRYKGVPFYYIRFYGYESVKPGESEGLAHIRCWLALYKLGVTHVIGGASSGGIRTDYDYDDLVVVDDFMDMESNRPQNILHYAEVERPGIFANYAHPYSPSLRKLIIEEGRKAQEGYTGKLWEQGVFVQHNPERFETAAEVRAMRILGGDLCSENIATVTTYARQLGIRFAAICSISNPAVGVRPFSFVDMQQSVQRISKQAIPIALEVIARIPRDAMEPEPVSTGERYSGSYTDPDAEMSGILEEE
jgi:purine nucleoside phosphorylase